jgi:flagellar basal-body rod protein FlgB
MSACLAHVDPQGFGAIAAIEPPLPTRIVRRRRTGLANPPEYLAGEYRTMIGKLTEELNFHSVALRLRSERQQVLSANIANADTPGYKAVDFDFSRALGEAMAKPAAATTTATGHIPLGPRPGAPAVQYRNPSQPSIDGNSVEMDAERAQFADNAIRYEATLRLLNGQIKSMMSAISG